MAQAARLPLEGWANFYVIVGSAAGGLTGLMFVVISLIRDTRTSSTGESVSAFGTPTVVHFCMALLVASGLSAPWGGLRPAGLAVAMIGLGGIAYVFVVARRAKRQHEYEPVLEDWIWHTVLPFAAYGLLLFAGLGVVGRPRAGLAIVAVSTLLLLFIGIHNAWDTVTYVALTNRRRPDDGPRPPGAE